MSGFKSISDSAPQKVSPQTTPVQQPTTPVKESESVIEAPKSTPKPEIFEEIKSSSLELKEKLAPTDDLTQDLISGLIESHEIDKHNQVPQPKDLEVITQLQQELGQTTQTCLQSLTQSTEENDIRDLLFNPDKKLAFADFAKGEYADDSLHFVNQFKAVLEHKPLQAKALLQLYKQFMAPDAPERINVAGPRFEALDKAFRGLIQARRTGTEKEQLQVMGKMLEEVSSAADDVISMLGRDTRGRFLRSEHHDHMDYYRSVVTLSSTPSKLREFTTLDQSQDRFVRENSLKVFRSTHMEDLRALHQNLLGSQQHLEVQAQELIDLFPDNPKIKPQLERLQAMEESLGKLMISLGQALGKDERETVELKHKSIQKLQTQMTEELQKLQELVPPFTHGDKAVRRFAALKQEALQLKVQRSYLDMFMNVKGLGEAGVQFFGSGEMDFMSELGSHDRHTKTQGLTHEVKLFDLLDTKLEITEKNLHNAINEIAKSIKPDLTTDEGYEKFFNDVLNRKAFATMDHSLRGKFLLGLFKEGYANPGLIQDFLLNNARNMTEEPDLDFLKKPLIQKSAQFQVYKTSILKGHFGRLRSFLQASQTLKAWKAQGLDLSAVQDSEGKVKMQDFAKLKEALTDRHAGSNILLDYGARQSYLKKLKVLNIDTKPFEGQKGEALLRTIMTAMATGRVEDLKKTDFDTYLIAKEIEIKTPMTKEDMSVETHFPLFALYHQVQGHEQKEVLLSALKSPETPDLKVLEDVVGGLDQAKVALLHQALQGDVEVLKDEPELQALHEQLRESFAGRLPELTALVEHIPLNDDQLAEQMLSEYTDAYTLKASEPLLEARSTDANFDAYLKFHEDLKAEAAEHHYSEGEHLSQFQKQTNKLSVAFFKQFQTVLQEEDPGIRKNLTDELLDRFQFQRAQGKIQDFFMDYILRYASEDRREREEDSQKQMNVH